MKQIIKTLNLLVLVLLISQIGVGQVKKTVGPPKKTVGPPKKGGVQPKKLTTEDLFKKYLVTENEALANSIIQTNDSLYGFYCQAVLSQDMEEKINLFTRFIDLNPKSGLAKAYLNRGATYIFSGKYEMSLEDFDKSIKLDPKEKYAFYFRGTAYHSLEQEDKAILDFNQVIKMHPAFILSYQMRGSCFINKKDYKRAMADLNGVIKSDLTNDQAFLLRGMAYDGMEEYSLAISDWKEARKLNKENANIVADLIDKAKAKEKLKGKK